ncbi:hypothetical protein D3C73_430340 [compost metagenome]
MEAASADHVYARVAKPPTKVRRKTYLFLFMSWVLLITGGIYGAKLYTENLQQQIANDIASQTQVQLKVIQDDYSKQVTELKDKVSSDMIKLQSKVDSLNQLLAFTKDSANSKTDNSNLLYTQLAEVKLKLEELQKNLEVLQ